MTLPPEVEKKIAVRVPSVLTKMRWWAKEIRRQQSALDGGE